MTRACEERLESFASEAGERFDFGRMRRVRAARLAAVAGWLVLPLTSCGADEARVPESMPEAPAGAGVPEPEPEAPSDGPLAQTPPMGFNNWNAFGCDVNEALIKETADFFVSSGRKEAGYQYVNIDDCWSTMERDAEGKLVPDPVKFPSGIAGLAEYVHGLGLKLGIYGDAGTRTCAGYPGSLGHEEVDAQTFADWGVDYLKYDNCFNESDGSREDFVRRYTAMQAALAKTQRRIVYSICEWGQSQPWEWAADVGHLWRTTGDITDNWSSVRDIITFNAPLAPYAGPGHWNDPDMLEVGNGGMTSIEYRTHMSMWAMMAAPLIIGTDLRAATPETLAILENRELIAIDQDPLGKPGTVIASNQGLMVLGKPLSSGEVAVALYNSTDTQALVSAPAVDVGLAAAGGYYLHDIWTGKALETQALIAAGVPAHGTVVYRARPLEPSDVAPPSLTLEGTLGTLIPGLADAATLTTKVTHRGIAVAKAVTLEVQPPAGWTIAASTANNSAELAVGASLETTWTVSVPPGTAAGRYPIVLTAAFTYGDGSSASATSELVGAVAVAPAAGATHLSTLLAVSSTNAVGPVELDMSNGVEPEGDGNLITIGGKIYTRGLGTHAASSVVYYLGGACSELTVDVGIDDEVAAGAASFAIYADDRLAAESGVLTAADPAATLTAELTGANLLRLVTDPAGDGAGDHTDWASPRIVCGGSTEPTTVERTLFSFESGTDEFTIANAGAGGSVAASTTFATDGARALSVTSPADGNWYGRRFAEPLDLSAFSTLRYDVKTGVNGTPGEFALEVGASSSWCQGGLWTWTNPSASKTIVRRFEEIECPEGVRLDLTQVRAIWVYLKDGTFEIDQLRAE
jgi:alpha-galactosidase